jgi:hypothetical protein
MQLSMFETSSNSGAWCFCLIHVLQSTCQLAFANVSTISYSVPLIHLNIVITCPPGTHMPRGATCNCRTPRGEASHLRDRCSGHSSIEQLSESVLFSLIMVNCTRSYSSLSSLYRGPRRLREFTYYLFHFVRVGSDHIRRLNSPCLRYIRLTTHSLLNGRPRLRMCGR